MQTQPDAETGTAIIQVEDGGENTICVVSGASSQVEWTPRALDWLRTHPRGSVLLQQEVPAAVNIAAARAAREHGIATYYNAAPAPTLTPEISELLSLVDVLTVNEHEARTLAAIPEDSRATTTELLNQLTHLGPPTVVLTLGAAGAMAISGGAIFTCPAFPATPVDTVGAGDCFCAQFAFAHTSGASIEIALRSACAAGALATQSVGAISSLPTGADVSTMLTRHPSVLATLQETGESPPES